jgi:hypothetical protein
MDWIRQHKGTSAIAAVVAAGVVAFLIFGVFGIHTAFIDDKVSEDNPFAAGAGVSGLESDEMSSDLVAAMNDAMEDAASGQTTGEGAPDMAEVTSLASGQFEGRSHPAEGQADIITDGDRTFLRFEDDFATDNGPDLNVYLSTAPIGADAEAFDDDFVDLGDLKGNVGSQNYEIDPSVDLSQYQTVVVWCVRFSVAFGAAPLSAG